MTLMFGNLTLAFVQFGTAVQNAYAPGASPAAMQGLTDAANHFKNTAASDALYLVYIGMFLLLSYHPGCTFCLLPPSRFPASPIMHGPTEPYTCPLPLMIPVPCFSGVPGG